MQRAGAPRGRWNELNSELARYISTLQYEFAKVEWRAGELRLPSKHRRIETYYFPLGTMRYPYFGRLLFGFYLFNSHLDGVIAWTMHRVRGVNPFLEASSNTATLAYPAATMIYPTYSLESVREGVDDLRYAQTAFNHIATLLTSGNAASRERSKSLREEFMKLMEPFQKLLVRGKWIDTVYPEKKLCQTREQLAALIIKAISIQAPAARECKKNEPQPQAAHL